MDRVVAAARHEPLIAALFAAGAVCVVLPIWIGRYVPLLDYPNHLSMVFVWFHLNDPEWNLAPFYTIALPPLPYWAHYGAVYALSFLVGPEIGQKLFLSGAVLLFPLALAVYARRMGRDPRLALLGFPLAWSYSTANGFLSYVAGIPVLLLALAALDRHAERPSLRWGALSAALGMALYFFHVIPWALFLIIGGLCAPLSPRPWTPLRALLAALPILPAAALGLFAYRAARGVETPFNPWSPQGLDAWEGAYRSLFDNLSGIPGWLIDFHPGYTDELALVVIGGAWLLLLATRAPGDGGGRADDDLSLRGFRVELALAITTAAFLLLPKSLMRPFYWYGVNGRVVVIMALFGVLLVRGRVLGLRRVFLVVAALAGIGYCGDVAHHFYQFNQRARGFDEVMAAVPRGKQVLPIMLDLSDPAIAVNAFNQWGSYVQMRQGGYMQYNFVSQFPVRYRRRLAAPPWDHNELFDFARHGRDWDYFLVRGRGPDGSGLDPFAGVRDRVRQVARSGRWELWQKLEAAGGDPSPRR